MVAVRLPLGTPLCEDFGDRRHALVGLGWPTGRAKAGHNVTWKGILRCRSGFWGGGLPLFMDAAIIVPGSRGCCSSWHVTCFVTPCGAGIRL